MKRTLLILFIGLVAYVGCTKMAPEFNDDDPGLDNCTPQFPDIDVTYNNYVRNVVTRNCTESCHKGGNSLGPGNFTTYEGIRPYVGDLFYYRVIQDRADMPQGNAPLPKEMRDSLDVWVKNCGPRGE